MWEFSAISNITEVLRDQRDVGEVLDRIERHVGVERRGVDVRGGGDEPGIAVGRRLRHVRGADDAAGTGAVLDHQRLAEARHLRGQHADDEIGAARPAAMAPPRGSVLLEMRKAKVGHSPGRPQGRCTRQCMREARALISKPPPRENRDGSERR